MAGRLETRIEAIVGDIIAGLGYELVDIEFVKKGSEPAELIIYIDKDGGITLDDTEIVSRAIDGPMDEADPIDSQYVLCVSSPGIDRPFKKDRDFEKHTGNTVDVKLYKKTDGVKEFSGVLAAFDADTVTIDIEGEEKVFNRKDIAVIRAHIDF